ncbi:L-serine ammonia-lyase, iron-sulfur-dependent, subunit alpha [Gemmiger sp. An120]|uniref:L-serine ammonia-lyase, iron-sulfur-dependent, subunit alpha n=1 Tax=Gemmiger sp. An120 TaxID=1965549 RepID=UPI000B38EB57|nr:L-serine ammonia-lyase, iron-sulfur-dependent, subunit alpha [Gemmiger sp. An120]OUQ38507.1 L-serine ammonia-lyase, iron-sulfur-dependent, subunit alpha [Gemmiger sp. An120]HIX33517.1 L-serine ammonia-lyase, iron-sulfur-dependent, subunit alpha [Candidatus Gemmiger avium]
MLDYTSIHELAVQAAAQGVTIGQLALADQAAQTETAPDILVRRMRRNLEVMQAAARDGAAKDLRSTSGLTGGDAWKMREYLARGGALCGPVGARAIAIALAVAEYNAAMGRIVAAPTAGSCGILPGAVLALLEQGLADEDAAVDGLFCAGAIGMVIANQASIAGAEGGCQAECGSASAMAAAALVQMRGGTPAMAEQAAAIAIKNQLGLVCDPVAGLVEVPCIKRNAGGVTNALTAADMALAGIVSVIPVDEVVSAMREVGESLPCALRETAQGGLAATPTGKRIREQLFGKQN